MNVDWPLIICALAALACFGVIFFLGISALAEHRAAEPLSERDRAACPWPIDDEAEADGLVAEFHPFHSRGDKA